MSDVLAVFPPNRQAAIVRKFLCREGPVNAELAELGRYRSAEAVRAIIAAERSMSCGPRFRYDTGILPTPFKNASRRRLYEVLSAKFGPMCMACGEIYGRVIDHDHMSGMVRGLVCRDCNHVLEHCLHANSAACRRARYLNEPPAGKLQLRYPARHRERALDVVREAILGFDIFNRDQWPSPIPADWRWTIPDEATLHAVEIEWWKRHPTADGCPRDLIGAEPW